MDFQRRNSPPISVSINGEGVEMVGTYKLLGVHLYNKLDWSDNTDAPLQDGTEQTVLPEEAQVFQCVH